MERDINMKTTEELVEKVLNENIASSIYLDNCVYYEEDVKRMLIQTATEQETIDENEWENKIAALKKWLSDDNNNAIVNEGQMGFVDIYDLLMFINNGFKAMEE